ncbi:hypothetical protein SVIOM342S_09752 [Streptomyces violaceorubidus]
MVLGVEGDRGADLGGGLDDRADVVQCQFVPAVQRLPNMERFTDISARVPSSSGLSRSISSR